MQNTPYQKFVYTPTFYQKYIKYSIPMLMLKAALHWDWRAFRAYIRF